MMKKVLFPILALVLAVGLAIPTAGIAGAIPDTIWTIGSPDDSKDEFGSSFPGNTTTYNVGDPLTGFPGIYYVGSSLSDGVVTVTISFSLDYAYTNVNLRYDRDGAELDSVSLDGGTAQTCAGTEGVWATYNLGFGTVAGGAHYITITASANDGGNGIHWADYLELTGNPVMPTITTSDTFDDDVLVGTVVSGNITIQICPDDTEDLTGVVVQGGISAELVVTQVNGEDVDADLTKPGNQPLSRRQSWTDSTDDITLAKKGGKMGATIVTWTVGDLEDTDACPSIILTAETGLQAKNKQCYTSEGEHELDGGFSATYWYGDPAMEYETPETDPLTINAWETLP